MRLKQNTRFAAFGLVGLLIVLVILAGLAILNWEKVKSFGDKKQEQLQEGKDQVQKVQEQVEDLQKQMQKRLDENLNQAN